MKYLRTMYVMKALGLQQTLKCNLSFLLVTLLILSAPANATKVKFLFSPGGILDFTNTAGGNVPADRSGEQKSNYGYGVALDLGNGPHTLAIDYYSRIVTTTSSKYNGLFGVSSGTGDISIAGLVDAKKTTTGDALFFRIPV